MEATPKSLDPSESSSATRGLESVGNDVAAATGGGGHAAPPTGTLIDCGRYGWIKQFPDGSYFFLGAR